MNKAPLVVVMAALSSSVCGATTQPDHLVPVDFVDRHEKIFREYLYQRLCLTDFDCGRYLVMPSFVKSEVCVSLYSRRDTARGIKCYVTSVEAGDNLRDWTDAGRLPDRAKKVKVRRIDAELPRSTCTLVKAVWIRMLSGRQTPRKPEYGTDVIWGDPTDAEFAIKLAGGKILRGETELVPNVGKNTTRLTEISDGLIDYCKAPNSKRTAMLAKLEEKAKALLARLESAR
jgi:hypothetical protein